MSRTADVLLARLRRRLAREDGGFTLLEVMVSLTVFAVVTAGVTPLLVSGLRAGLVSKLDTGAKNLSQERFEIMRNLPFHVDAQVSNSPDMLDTYFPAATGTAACGAQGYVAAAVARCTTDGDPATGAFYRYVLAAVPGYPKYKEYVATQFLDSARNAVTPGGTYNAATVGYDSPPSPLVGVSVTTIWTASGLSKRFRAFSQIQDGRPATSRVVAQTRATALKLSSNTDADHLLIMEAGVVDLDGALASGSNAAASALGAYTSLTPGTRADGALGTAAAPPNATSGPTSAGVNGLIGTGYDARFAGTTTANVGASVTGGDPVVASSASPVTATVGSTGLGSYSVRYSNNASPSSHLMLDTALPLAWVANTATAVQATGSISSVGGGAHSVTARAGGVTAAVHLFPTTYAPDGVVTLTLSSASLVCTANGTSSSATPSYSATLTYRSYNISTGVYTPVTVSWSYGASDPLQAVALNTVVGKDLGNAPIYLGDYIGSWLSTTTSIAASQIQAQTDSNAVTANMTGFVQVTTQPTRVGDQTSALSMQLGIFSCTTEDNR